MGYPVQQHVHALSGEKLAPLQMAGASLLAPALRGPVETVTQVSEKLLVRLAVSGRGSHRAATFQLSRTN